MEMQIFYISDVIESVTMMLIFVFIKLFKYILMQFLYSDSHTPLLRLACIKFSFYIKLVELDIKITYTGS